MNDNIILIGMPGSGKSTVGVLLAKALGMGFLDIDLIIQQREGALLQDILDRVGTDRFLEIEADAVCSIRASSTVISTGGSAVLCERGARHLKELGTMIYLRSDPAELVQHLTNLSDRGIACQPGQTVADIYSYRAPFYEKYANVTVDTTGQNLAETVASVLAAVGIQRRQN